MPPPPSNITEHEGRKYLRPVTCAVTGATAHVDVYEVLLAWAVACPARQHAVKKLLAAGTRGKGDALADLLGAQAAVSRAIEFARRAAAGRRPPRRPKR